MARRRVMFLVALLCVVIVIAVAFAAGDWVGQATEVAALATPSPTSDIGNVIAPDVLIRNDSISYFGHGRSGRAASFYEQ